MSDEIKAIPLEERMARVRKSMDFYIGGSTGHDWAILWKSAFDGNPFRVDTNSNFFKYVLMTHPESIEILGSLLSLKPAQIARIQGHQQKENNAATSN
jgi:hypothetical protein